MNKDSKSGWDKHKKSIKLLRILGERPQYKREFVLFALVAIISTSILAYLFF